MVIYSKYKFAFQHINRCGGTSVRKALESVIGPADELSAPPGAAHQAMKSRLKRLRNKGIDIDNYNIYANVRNPFARIVSIYHFRKRIGRYKKVTFEEFFYGQYLEELTTPSGPIYKLLLVDGKLPPNVKVIKLEGIGKHWPGIILKHFGKEVKMPQLNGVDHDVPMIYYNRDMIDKVKESEDWVIRSFYPGLRKL